MKFVRVLHRVFVFLVFPLLGYLLGATIFNHFYDKHDTGDLANADFIAVAEFCWSDGPLTARGFGYRWSCSAEVTQPSSGSVATTITTGFLTPEDIGEQVAVVLTRRSAGFAPQDRPYQGLGMILLFPFGILWYYLLALLANPLMKNRIDRVAKAARDQKSVTGVHDAGDRTVRTAQNQEPAEPVTEVQVSGGRKGWLPGRIAFILLVLSSYVVITNAGGAFSAPLHRGLVLFSVGLAVLLALIGYGAWRLSIYPSVTVTSAGLTLKEEFLWERIRHVRMVDSRLVVHLHDGPPVTTGQFGVPEVGKIHDAMRLFSPVPYASVPGPLVR